MNNDHSVHPRPQLVRDQWIDLCGQWELGFDDGDRGLTEYWYDPERRVGPERARFDQQIMVPYPPESTASGIGDPSYHPVVWYRKTFEAPRLGAEERLLLHFGAVDYRATVWVNGHHLGGHEGGHTPFSFDITHAVDQERGEQTLVVRAADAPTDVGQPRGKQDWLPEPYGIFYDRTTGIWQPVWLEPVPAVHLTELHWTPDPPAARVTLDVQLANLPAHPTDRPVTLRVRLELDGELLAEQSARLTGEETARTVVDVPTLHSGLHRRPLLWSPESPTLVDAEVTLLEGDGAGEQRVVDRVASYLGLRSTSFRDGLFCLNGMPYYLRLVLEQGYWPSSHLAAPDPDALRHEVELVKELGFNGVRVHQKVEDPRFLYWCDRLGLLVWGEMANAFAYTTQAAERLVREWLEVVRRDRGHPCVVTWVPLNESWGVPHIAADEQQRHYATALYHLTKALDPTRPVISNDGWEHTESDIWGVHDYAPTGQSLRERYGDPEEVRRMLHGLGPGRHRVLLGEPTYRGQPVVLTELGGLSYAPAAGEKWHGYGIVASADEYLAAFADLVTAVLDSTELAGFCYTQLTDTLQERNGLLTADRVPKLPVDAVREVVTRPSRAIPAEAVDAHRRRARKK